MMRLLLLVIIGGLMHAARSFSPSPQLTTASAGVALACGYLLISAFLTGSIFKQLRLPRLTGYLTFGILAGPYALNLVTESMVSDLKLFNGIAIGLIALTAGTEMDFRSLRPLVRVIIWVTLIAVIGTAAIIAGAVYLARTMLPFFGDFTPIQAMAVAAVLGVTMAAQSPAVAVALRTEMNADGPLSRTVLALVVVSDLVIILLFALVSSVAKATFGAQTDFVETVAMLIWELLGSLVAGLLIGFVVAGYLRKVQKGGALFVVMLGLVIAEVGQRVHLDPLLIALAVGVFIRNTTNVAERLHAEIKAGSLPVYVVFFALAGATIHLDALAVVGIPAALFVIVRAMGFLAGCRAAARIAAAPEVVRRYVGFGLLPQAGLALALALLFARAFPSFGSDASALTLSVVAMNELLAPVAYRWALVRSGEAGSADTASELAATEQGATA